MAITARILLQEGLVERVLILDLDVHQVLLRPCKLLVHIRRFSSLFWSCSRSSALQGKSEIKKPENKSMVTLKGISVHEHIPCC